MTCLDPKTIWPNEAVPNVRYRDFSKMFVLLRVMKISLKEKDLIKMGQTQIKKYL